MYKENTLGSGLGNSAFFLVFLITCLLLPQVSFATEADSDKNWYEVQMVVFLNNHVTSKEHWLSNPPVLNIPQNAVALKTPEEIKAENLKPDVDRGFMVQLSPQKSFMKLVSKLQQSQFYSVVYFVRFRFPLNTFSEPISVIIPSSVVNGTAVSGYVSFFQRHLLHVEPKLVFHLVSNRSSQNKTIDERKNILDSSWFEMQQKQRIFLNRLTYLDNPVAGILVQVSRYKKATNDDTADKAE